MENTSWQADKLDRQEECLFLSNYLRSKFKQKLQPGSFVLNITAEQGLGKSYFVCNWAQDLIAQGHPVVQFNAWDTDFSTEPLLCLLSEFHFKLSAGLIKAPKALRLLQRAIDKGKNLIKPSQPVVTSLLNNTLTGLSRKKLNELMALEDKLEQGADEKSESEYLDVLSNIMPAAAEQTLKNHKRIQESIAAFKDEMAKFLMHIDKEMQSLNLPLFVFIDELDHCRPEYSIELLEKIKQLFNMRGIVFVIAADAKQLAYSIKSVYGPSADASRYLQQFFDQQYSLITPKKYKYVEHLFQKFHLEEEARFFTPLSIKFSVTRNVHMDLFAIMAKYFKLDLGSQDQVCSMLQTVCLTWNLEKKIHLVYLLFLLMLQQRNEGLSQQYLKASKLSERMNVLEDPVYQNLIDVSVIVRTNMETRNRMHTPEKKEPFDNVIHKYVEYASLSMPEVAMDNSATLEVYSTVREQLIIGLPEQYNLEAPPRHALWRYHDMVRKVSHLIRG